MSVRRALAAAVGATALAAALVVPMASAGARSSGDDQPGGPSTDPVVTTSDSPPATTSASTTPTTSITIAPPTTPTTTSPTTTPPTTTTTSPTTTTTPPTTSTPATTTPTPTTPAGPIIDHEAAEAFAKATEQLRKATEALLEAEHLVVGGDARLTFALAQQRRAETAELLASGRVAVIDDDIAARTVDLALAEASIAGHARQVYQDGPLGAYAAVLQADGPADFASRATDLDTITATSERNVQRVLALQDELEDLRTARADAVGLRRTSRDEAESTADERARLASEITVAGIDVEALQAAVDEAIEAAKAAIPADQALAAQRGAESDRLGAQMVELAEELEASDDVVLGTGTFTRPATGAVTSTYGYRVHPILGYVKLHTGVDYDGADGVVYAADRGTVLMTVYNTAYGNVTVIDHGRSGNQLLATFYAHQAGFFVEPGDVVEKGQPIGAVGSTGLSTGPHLHFEVRLDGTPVDPRPFVD